MNEILAIIPAHNEGLNIERVVEGLLRLAPQCDYVIINDGSTDDTLTRCQDRGFKVIDLPINLGLAGAFQTGLKYAHRHGYRYAIQFDGDGQHRPEFIGAMKEKMDEGYGIVIGSRFLTEKKPASMRMLGSRLLSAAIHMTTGVRLSDPTSGMRMFNERLIAEFANGLNYGPEPDTISYLLKQGAKIAEVQVTMDKRLLGESYLNPVAAIRYMGKMMFSILLIQNFRKRDVRQEKKRGDKK